jgi:hypothetical protein
MELLCNQGSNTIIFTTTIFFMATASEVEKIKSNPINEGLNAFRELFHSTCADLSIAISPDAVQVVFSTAAVAGMPNFFCLRPLLTYVAAKNLVLDLILALANEPAARILPSPISNGTLSHDLGILYGRVDAGRVDIALSIPLVERIVGNEPDAPTWNDTDIWHAVFELASRANIITSPTIFAKATLDTPLRPSSASQSGIEQTHDEVGQRILEELTGRVFYDVGGFYERYFEGKSWTNNARDIYECQEPSIQRVTGAGGQSLQYKVPFLSGS